MSRRRELRKQLRWERFSARCDAVAAPHVQLWGLWRAYGWSRHHLRYERRHRTAFWLAVRGGAHR